MNGRLLGVAALVVGMGVFASWKPLLAQVPAVRALQAALVELDGVIATLDDMRPSRSRDRALRQAAEARTRLVDGLATLVVEESRPPRYPPVPPRMQPDGPEPIDLQRFGDLVNRLQELSFAKDQMAYLMDVVRNNRFTTEQVRRVMQVFTFDADKVKVAIAMYPVVLNKADFHAAQHELTFESDRERLRSEVQRIDAAGMGRDYEDR